MGFLAHFTCVKDFPLVYPMICVASLPGGEICEPGQRIDRFRNRICKEMRIVMTIKNDAAPTGTGQEGARTPAGVKVEVPIHTEGKSTDKLDQLANRAARKGVKRQNKNDATIFTK